MTDADKKLENRVAIVTGAAGDMGLAIGQQLLAAGASVLLSDIDGEGVAAAAARLHGDASRVLALGADATSEDDASAMVSAATERFGGVDILVNNAGILRPTRVDEISVEEWELVVDGNLKSTFVCSRAVLPTMKRNRYGRIVNMSSSAGRSVSTLGGAHYTAAKAGILGLTRALAKEMAPYGITSNSVCPGLIDTGMVAANCSPERVKAYEESFPISRLGSPQEVAQLVLFLVSEADYITGAAVDINGGDLMI
jgi:NAD(P)-dependent dehydrogenase (short-subunit alcohol dehydrogenase family)